VPRFYTPLIEPDVQISRIRLSEEVSRCAHGKLAGRDLSRTKPNFEYMSRCTQSPEIAQNGYFTALKHRNLPW
jgi:hypothetical protein